MGPSSLTTWGKTMKTGSFPNCQEHIPGSECPGDQRRQTHARLIQDRRRWAVGRKEGLWCIGNPSLGLSLSSVQEGLGPALTVWPPKLDPPPTFPFQRPSPSSQEHSFRDQLWVPPRFVSNFQSAAHLSVLLAAASLRSSVS